MKKPMNRRQFLRASLVSAGSISAVSLVGCGGGESEVSTLMDGAFNSSSPADKYFPQSVASGDPSSSSIVLWTRLDNLGGNSVDLQVSTSASFAESDIVAAEDVTAFIDALNDNCLKIKVAGLTEGSTYYYQFVVRNVDTLVQRSRTGRFKTAGDNMNETPVKFASLSCQDYIGRYYNSLFSLLSAENDDMDFVLHLGDYIYETTGDPSFQSINGRTVQFADPDQALTITKNGNSFLAAQSVSNYRDLYKTYRSDKVLQRVHEKFAFVNIWDDHEFSDDSWQDNGTYQGVETGEQDTTRKANAAKAFFEFQPIDWDGSAALSTGDNSTSSAGAGTSVNRNLRFGKHVNLALADYRTNRPDHLIPEDAFPGEIVMNQSDCENILVTLGQATAMTAPFAVKSLFFKYITSNPASSGSDLYPVTASALTGDSPFLPIATLTGIDPMTPSNSGALTLALAGGYTQAYVAAGMDPAAAQSAGFGKAATLLSSTVSLDIVSINATLENAALAQEAAGQAAAAAQLRAIKVVDDGDTLSHGLSYAQMGKQTLAGSSLGSRYLVVKSSYELYCAHRSLVLGDTAYDNAWGDAQTGALLTGMAMNGDATWQVLGSSVSFTSLLLNGSLLANAIDSLSPGASAAIPPELKNNTFYLNVDQWDGFPIRRRVLMGDVPSALPTTLKALNTVILSGDIHASFATDHGVDTGGNRAVEFTVAGVSSASFSDLLGNQAGALLAGNPAAGSLVTALPLLIDPLLQGANQYELGVAQQTAPETVPALQNMKMSKATVNGTLVLTATATDLTARYYHYEGLAEASNIYALGGIPPLEVRTFTVAKAAGKNGPVTEV